MRLSKLAILNPCMRSLPDDLANHALMHTIWRGLDPAYVWDSHVHLIGDGASGSGAWINEEMGSWKNPLLNLQQFFYMNAACLDGVANVDRHNIERLLDLMADFPAGCKAMLYANDWTRDEQGRIVKEKTIFHIPNEYAAHIAKNYPDRFEWAASIHPYRPDAVDALHGCAAAGARAVKWLPSTMAIDPASARCYRFYEAAQALDMPIITHAGHRALAADETRDFGNPLRLKRALDAGVRIVIAHCANNGENRDLSKGESGGYVDSFELFTRMMNDRRYERLLHADISSITQRDHVETLKTVLRNNAWHSRLINGSDYPLPGILPLFSPSALADEALLDPSYAAFLERLQPYHPLLFDFALKRLVSYEGVSFPASVFESRRFFETRRPGGARTAPKKPRGKTPG